MRSTVIILLAAGVVVATAQAAPSPEECRARANDSEAKLVECIQRDTLWAHLKEFQKIADAHPDAHGHPTRDTGTAGYRASVDYVAKEMREAGYTVSIQSYPWQHFAVIGAPTLRIDDKAVANSDWFVARLSGSGAPTAQVQAVGVENTASASGCEAQDFRTFRRGRIALLERGSCDADAQVARAQAAGATAVVLYNSARAMMPGESRRAHNNGNAYPALLTEPANIPVIGALPHALGAELAARSRMGRAPQAEIAIRTQRRSDTDYNVIADSPYGDPNHTVVVEGHLDSIYGAGMLDNASGSVSILETALNLAHTRTRNRLRYIWFGGEELGLLGSKYYTRTLGKQELHKLAFDIDVDVTATPNFDVLIADPGHANGASNFPPNVIPQSKLGNRAFTEWFRSAGITSRLARFGNDGTDSLSFAKVGVPDSGILTQQDCCKHEWEVALWGGTLGNYEGKVPGHDGGCVDRRHRWCDNLSNNDPFVLTFATKAVAAVTLKLANHRFD